MYATTSTLRSSRVVGLYHHHRPPLAPSKFTKMECLFYAYLLLLLKLSRTLLTLLLLALALLQKGLGHEDLIFGRHAPAIPKSGCVSIVCPQESRIDTPSSELQLKRGILGLENRLDDIDLISEYRQSTTRLYCREEADSFS